MNASLNLSKFLHAYQKHIAYQCRRLEMTHETQKHQQQHQYRHLEV